VQHRTFQLAQTLFQIDDLIPQGFAAVLQVLQEIGRVRIFIALLGERRDALLGIVQKDVSLGKTGGEQLAAVIRVIGHLAGLKRNREGWAQADGVIGAMGRKHGEKPMDLQVENWPIARLNPYGANARIHSPAQVRQIAASLREFGFNVPCLIDDKGEPIAGHGRLLAAKELDLKSVP